MNPIGKFKTDYKVMREDFAKKKKKNMKFLNIKSDIYSSETLNKDFVIEQCQLNKISYINSGNFYLNFCEFATMYIPIITTHSMVQTSLQKKIIEDLVKIWSYFYPEVGGRIFLRNFSDK
jgi:hypothetical protein